MPNKSEPKDKLSSLTICVSDERFLFALLTENHFFFLFPDSAAPETVGETATSITQRFHHLKGVVIISGERWHLN